MTPAGRRISIAHLALIVPWIALVIDAWQPVGDSSFLWHVRAGELQLESGSVITREPFSFTMGGTEWITQSWLVELLYAWAEDISGLNFVPAMILVVSTVLFVGIGLVGYRHSRSVSATAFVLVLSTLALISFLVPRPVLFSFLFMILVVAAWDRPMTRWALPFLFWIWASIHASFLIGLAYVGLTLLARKDWRSLPIAISAGLITLATAHGLGVLRFLLDFSANREALEFITEWRKPELFSAVFLPFLGGMVFVVIGAFRDMVYPRHLWVLVPFVALGMSSVRAIPPAWLGIVPLVALSLAGIEIGLENGLRPRLALIFALVVFLMPFLVAEGGGLPEERFPVAASQFLADVPTFHDDRTGGYLIWSEGPERLVYFDDRAEVYGWRMEEFVKVRNGDENWQMVFERDGVEQALLSSGEPLVKELEDAGWHTIYQDSSYRVLQPP